MTITGAPGLATQYFLVARYAESQQQQQERRRWARHGL